MRIVEYSRKFLGLKERPKDDKPSYFILSRFNKLITKGKAKNISLLTNQKNNENLINKLLEKVFNKTIPPKFIQIKLHQKEVKQLQSLFPTYITSCTSTLHLSSLEYLMILPKH